VLDGELAVPCNLQPAIAGFNSHTEVRGVNIEISFEINVEGLSPEQIKVA